MGTVRTKVQHCVMCNREYMATFNHALNRFSQTCGPKCNKQLGDLTKKGRRNDR